jgi:hypothetical protein
MTQMGYTPPVLWSIPKTREIKNKLSTVKKRNQTEK